MLSHSNIWLAIDLLAARNHLSASGLAKRAGLDPTTFNKSKRKFGDDRLRWPSTESISKILLATNTSPLSFVKMLDQDQDIGNVYYPISDENSISIDIFDGSGFPKRELWNESDQLNFVGVHSFLIMTRHKLGMSGDYRESLFEIDPEAKIDLGDFVFFVDSNGRPGLGTVKSKRHESLEVASDDSVYGFEGLPEHALWFDKVTCIRL